MRIAHILLVLVASRLLAQDLKEEPDQSSHAGLRLELRLTSPPTKGLKSARFLLTVTNARKQECTVDRELVMGFGFVVEPFPEVDARREIGPVEKPSQEKAKDRFVSLAPGQSLTREYTLVKPHKGELYGHDTYRDFRHVGFYREAQFIYDIPKESVALRVSVDYHGTMLMRTAEHARDEWYGIRLQGLGPCPGDASSNVVVVKEGQRTDSNQ